MTNWLPTLFLCIALSACSKATKQPDANPSDVWPVEAVESLYPRFKDPDFTAKGERIYTDEDLSDYPLKNYRNFPHNITILIQHYDIENDWCRGSSGEYPETLRACDRRDKLFDQLEKRGWCWGSTKASTSEAENYWLKCSDDPHYRNRNSDNE